ncbi:MAG: TetR/AcrR family transcriptional regulator [Salinibacterium sp.]|nr:TetR/AcrR family transcriptional regulator [Salinibacterium sp.]MBF0671364.1 TetR/AcrR family transcriptional regulator [Salinibacterium sp.]
MHNDTSNPGAAMTATDADPRTRLRLVAAGVFAKRGYNDASVEEVCSEAGVDAETFSAHYEDKYALFKDVVLANAREMVRATDGIETNDPRQARSVITRIIENATRVAIATRATGGFYRSEHRYLRREDARELSGLIGELHRRVRQPLMLHRPKLTEDDATLMAAAAFSVIASITIHATSLPAPKVQTLLTVTAMRMLDSEPSPAQVHMDQPATRPTWHDDTSRDGQLLKAAVDLCFQRGYHAVTIDEVATAAGVDVEWARQHTSLSDILTRGCLSGHKALEIDLNYALESSVSARDTLLGLCRAYVRHYMVDYKLMTVYLADARNFDDGNHGTMLALQDYSVNLCTKAMQDARPELSHTEATFLVFAAMSLVSDLARMLRWKNDDATTSRIEKFACMVMALIR